jgi:hypothetical protein
VTVAARTRWIVAGVAGAAALVALVPRAETLPSEEPLAETPPEEALVRVRRGGRTLVYDKRRGWMSAKAAEWFPTVTTGVVPADYVALDGGPLVARRVELHAPWWR